MDHTRAAINRHMFISLDLFDSRVMKFGTRAEGTYIKYNSVWTHSHAVGQEEKT
jgi:hypothetical protein